jgi:tetratricopeptide (TPR) repeat protein
MKLFALFFFCFALLQAQVQLSQTTYNNLIEIQKLSQEKKFTLALKKVESTLSKKISDIDKAYLFQTQGFIYISQNNYKQAIKSFLAMNSLHVMPHERYVQSLYNIAQLYLSLEKPQSSLKYINIYLKESQKENENIYLLAAQSYLLLEKYAQASTSLEHLIDLKQKKKNPIENNIYELLFSSNYKLKNYPKALKYLHVLIRKKPTNKQYWFYLYQTYTLNKQSFKAINSFEQAYNLNILQGKDLFSYVTFLANNSLYFKAAKMLSLYIKDTQKKATEKDLELLANLYFSAKEYEKAIESFKQLTKLYPKGSHFLKLARLYRLKNQTSRAIDIYLLTLKDIKFKKRYDAVLELAYLYYENDNLEQCKIYLNKAKTYKETKKKAEEMLEQING